MAYQHKDNSGSIFANDRKEKDTHPDFKGSALIDGVEYWVSGWDKTNTRGAFFSLSFTKKEAKKDSNANSDFAKSAQHYEAKQNGYQPDLDDDLPWA